MSLQVKTAPAVCSFSGNPFDETDLFDLGGHLCGFVCFAIVDESQIPCLPILSEARLCTLSLVIPFLSSSFSSSLHLFVHPLSLFNLLHPLSSIFFFSLHAPTHNLSPLSIPFLTISCPVCLAPHSFPPPTFSFQEATFIFGLWWVSVMSVRLPLADPLETIVIFCI